ncbi:MAG: CocE/NonD family hydrolase, partial [Acetobacteraceae bacterium]|nr:CocE/NonD family hydrolase [Acetobacteraceae bacterium]
DGAGYANGAIARFLTLPNPHRHLLLGPWDHGARANVSPWRDAVAPRFPLDGELLRFFDHYLMQRDTGLDREAPIHLFTMGAERWQAATQWPVATATRTLETGAGTETIRVDFAHGTGTNTRYERLAAANTQDYYADWPAHELPMWRSDSAPLDVDWELTGHAILDLRLSSTEPDAALHAYLSDVGADGAVRYVTEAALRALHRRETAPPQHYRAAWPFRSYCREDAAPLVSGEPTNMRLVFLPTSWLFRAGSRIRLSLAGADADHFGQVPHGRPPVLTIHRDATRLALPGRPA